LIGLGLKPSPRKRRTTGIDWAILAWVTLALLVVADAATQLGSEGTGTTLTGWFLLAPAIAAQGASVRATIAVAVAAIVAALASGLINDFFLSTGHVVRMSLVALVTPLCVRMALLRERDERTRRRFELTNAVRTSLAGSRSFEQEFYELARSATRGYCDWCVIDVVDGRNGQLRRLAAQADLTGTPAGFELSRTANAAAADLTHAARKDGPRLMGSPSEEQLGALFRAAPPGAQRRTQVMAVPIASRGGHLGTAYFASFDPRPPWSYDELIHAELWVASAATIAENARLLERVSETERELRHSRDEIAAIVGNMADGVTAVTPDGRLQYANAAAAERMGFGSPEEAIAAEPAEILARFDLFDDRGQPFPLERLPGRRALAGEEAPQDVLRYRVKSTGEEHWTMVKASPLRNDEGQVTAAISVMEDITAQKRSEIAQRFLAEAGKALSGSLDYHRTLREVANAAVPEVADWCAVEMPGDAGELELVALVHEDPQTVAMAYESRRRYPPQPEAVQGAYNVMRTGEPEHYPEVTDAMLREAAIDDEHLAVMRSLDLRSAVIVPIVADGETLGTITLIAGSTRPRFEAPELDMAVELGRRAGLALRNARVHTERSQVLQTLQRSMMPPRLPKVPGLQIAARYRPVAQDAELGGDFYDVFGLPCGDWAVVVGDVCGKGAEAAALTALARHTIRAAALREGKPQVILRMLNDAFREQIHDGRYCTVAMAKFHQSESGRSVEIVSAGHPLPIHVPASGRARPAGSHGTLLGIVGEPTLPSKRLELAPGDGLVLYTDGIASGTRIDETEFTASIIDEIGNGSADEMASKLERVAVERSRFDQRDDVAIVVAVNR
jgi:PAS domain S-box-containing protein